MASAGCFRIWFGTESGSDKVLREMKKGFDVEQVREAITLTRRAGISVGMFLMIGYPNENLADVRASARMLREMQPDEHGVSIAFPIKGTAFYERVKDEIGPGLEWKKGTDPNLRFRGRYPHRFYWLATRYIHHSLAASRLRHGGQGTSPRVAGHLAKTTVAALGMLGLAAISQLSLLWHRRPSAPLAAGDTKDVKTAKTVVRTT